MIHDPLVTIFVVVSFLFTSFFILKAYPLVYGKSFMPTGSKFFLFNYLIFIYVGVFLMNVLPLQKLELAYVYSTSLREHLLPMYILNIVMVPLFFLGAYFSNIILNSNDMKVENKLLYNFSLVNNKFYKSGFFIFMTVVLLLLVFITLKMYSSKIDKIPLLAILFENVSNVKMLRSEATNNFSGKKYRYDLVLKTIPLFLFILYYLIPRKKYFQKTVNVILFFICVFTALIDGVKGPVLQFFLLILMLSVFVQKGISLKKIFLFLLFILGATLTMYMFFMGMIDRDILDILRAPFNRVFLGSSMSMLYYLDYVPEYTDFLYGSSFPNPAGIFPFEWRKITVEVMNHAHPELAEMGIVGSMPATYYGEYYVNFGYFGAFFSMIFLGFFLKFIDNIAVSFLSRSRLSLPLLGLFFIYVHTAGTYSRTTFMGFFFDMDLYVSCFISMLLILVNQIYIKYKI